MIAAWLGLATATDVADLAAQLGSLRREHVELLEEAMTRHTALVREVRETVGLVRAELKAAAALREADDRHRHKRAARAAGRGHRVRKKARPA